MGRYHLCQLKKAHHPYHITSIGVDIYTIEELCFYLRQNVYLIDESIIGEELCIWLADELKQKGMAVTLMDYLKKDKGVGLFLTLIYRETGYLSPAEFRTMQEQLAGLQVQPEDHRRKLKADHLVERGMYASAINEYYKILRSRSQGSLGTKFFVSVLNNMAAAYARQFLFEEAADCLWQSYGIVRSGEVWRKYLAILPLYLSETEYKKRLEELVVPPEQIKKIEQRKREIIEQGIAEKRDSMNEENFVEDELEKYRRSVGIG